MLADLIEEGTKELELEYLNSTAKVTITRDIPRLSISGQVFENVKKDSILQVRQWMAEKMVETGVAQRTDHEVTVQQLMQLEWKEKNSVTELQPLGRYFYVEARRSAEHGPPELGERLRDIATLRMLKILNYASRRVRPDIRGRLTPEEEMLFQSVSVLVEEWMKRILGPEKLTTGGKT